MLLGPVTGAFAISQWVAPVTVSDPGQLNDNPQVVFDAQGEVITVWGRGQCSAPSGPPTMCTNSRIQAAIRSPGQSFGPVQTLTGDPGTVRGDLPQLHIAADAQGGAVAVWPSDESGKTKVRYALRAPGQPFGSVQTIEDPGIFITNPTVAVDPAGNMIALWISASSVTDGTARYAIGTTATGFGPSQPLPGDASAYPFGGPPQVAFDGQGGIIAAWGRNESNLPRVRVALGDLKGFGDPQTISEDSNVSDSNLDLATDGQGNAALVFTRQIPMSDTGVAYALRAPGQPFSAAQTTIAGNAGQSYDPDVAFAPGGRAVVVWANQDTGGWSIRYASREPGQSFGSAKTISGDPGDTAGGAQVALDGQGNAMVVWTSFDAGKSKVRFASAAPGQDLAYSGTLAGPDQGATTPQVAVDPQGNAVAAWGGYPPTFSSNIEAPILAAGYDAAGPLLRGLTLPSTGDTSKPVPFSVSPVDVWSPIASTRFSFGDGTALSAAAVPAPHTYRSAGTFQVSVTSTDTLGNSSSAAGAIKILDRTKPTISRLRMTRRTFAVGPRPTAIRAARTKKGSAFQYTLSERANVTITIERPKPGRRVGRSCRKPSSRLVHRKRCTRYVTAGTLTRRGSRAGRTTTKFSGRIGKRALKPGRYRATLRAKDPAGNSSAPKRITFRIVRP
jgi:PKD domain